MTKKEEEEEENRGRAVIEITRLYDLIDNTSTDRIDRRKVHVKWEELKLWKAEPH